MGGYYCCETSELKHKNLPNGVIEFWEEDTSTTYISRLKNFEWEVDKTKLNSSKATSQITWRVNGPMRGGDKISVNTKYNLDFIKFRKPTINDEIIGVDINQFMNWYYEKFSCIPTIEFEIGEGGTWKRDYKLDKTQYTLDVIGGDTSPTSLYTPVGVESVTILPKEEFRDYYRALPPNRAAALGPPRPGHSGTQFPSLPHGEPAGRSGKCDTFARTASYLHRRQ